MNLENVLLSERMKSQKATYCILHLYEMSKIGKPIERESKLINFRATKKKSRRQKKKKLITWLPGEGGSGFLVGDDGKSLKLGSGDVCPTLCLY